MWQTPTPADFWGWEGAPVDEHRGRPEALCSHSVLALLANEMLKTAVAAPDMMLSRLRHKRLPISASGAGSPGSCQTRKTAVKACWATAISRKVGRTRNVKGTMVLKDRGNPPQAFVRRAALISLGCSVITQNSTIPANTSSRRRPRPLRRDLLLSTLTFDRQPVALHGRVDKPITTTPASSVLASLSTFAPLATDELDTSLYLSPSHPVNGQLLESWISSGPN